MYDTARLHFSQLDKGGHIGSLLFADHIARSNHFINWAGTRVVDSESHQKLRHA